MDKWYAVKEGEELRKISDICVDGFKPSDIEFVGTKEEVESFIAEHSKTELDKAAESYAKSINSLDASNSVLKSDSASFKAGARWIIKQYEAFHQLEYGSVKTVEDMDRFIEKECK